MDDRVRVQFPMPDNYYFGMQPTNQPPKANSAFHPSGVGKWVPASAGKAKAGMVHSISGWTRGVQVKLRDPFRTRAIPERLRGVFTTNPRLPLPYLSLQMICISYFISYFLHMICISYFTSSVDMCIMKLCQNPDNFGVSLSELHGVLKLGGRRNARFMLQRVPCYVEFDDTD